MKSNFLKTLQFFLLVLSPFSLSAQLADRGVQSISEIEEFRSGRLSDLPDYIRFRKNQEIQFAQFETWIRENLSLSDNMGFELLKSEPDHLGHIHYRYQQTYLGKPIEDAIWILHTMDGQVYACNGLIFKNLEATDSRSLTKDQALEKATAFVGAESYKWQLPGEEQHLKWEKGDPTATYLPSEELVFITSDNKYEQASFRLAYKLNIYAHKPLYRAEVYIDASTGEILRENKLIHHVDEPGVAHTAYSGEQDIVADSFEGTYRLRDGSRGNGVRTFDMNQGTDYGGSDDFIDDDNDWDNVNPELDEYATDAHWGAERTYDYYNDIHGRNSLDNDGFQLNSYVHYDVNFFNAFWDGERMTYGDGDGMPSTPLTTLDIAGHEVTHGLTNFTANLIYSSESGALNESFSDIFGSAIEAFSRPDDWDWLLGEEIGVTIRSMSNPNDFSCPDTYQGDFWDEFEGVHTNSGVQNFWYYLIVEGGTGTNDNGDAYDVSSIGREAADAIAFRNLTVYLTPSSNYEDARFYSIQAATDLFGGCTEEVAQTANAWYAVGIGDPYSTEVIAAFSADETEGCEVPFTINFSNESLNGVDFIWDFGDGETSTETSPSHTYTEEGVFDVTLSVDGGSCGEDEIMIESYITIDPSLDCPIIFPTSGTGTTQTICEGTLYDSGGNDGDYGPSETATITISPDGAASVELTFVEFNVGYEFDFDCFSDNLKIYDGPSTSDPLIGTYCNGNLPTDISSSGPSITLEFESDDFIESAGFEIDWVCVNEIDDTGIDELQDHQVTIYPNPSNGSFTVSLDQIQSGSIEITDLIGKKILTLPINGPLVNIDLPKNHANGTYILSILDTDGKLLNNQRIVVQ